MSELYFEQGPIRPPSEAYSLLLRVTRNCPLGRRAGIYRSMEDLSNPDLRDQVEKALRRIELERPGGIEKVLAELMESFI